VVGTDGEIADDSHFLLTVRLSVFILTTHSMVMIDTWELFCFEIWCIAASLSLSLSLSLVVCLFVFFLDSSARQHTARTIKFKRIML
jgi:hypothetical protein